jgi:lipopolysaccharide transport system permease protein
MAPSLTRITAAPAWWPSPSELWAHRELLLFFAWRDLQVRYRQTALGVAWALLQPVLTMVVFAVVFGRLAGIPSDGAPYSLFVLCGIVPWQLFIFGLTNSATSLVANERLLTKVYFPRVILPASGVLGGLIDFSLSLVLLGGLLLAYGRPPGPAALALPFFVLLVIGAALGVGLLLSALSIRYRDVRHALPFLTQLWFFATPIAYPMSIFPPSVRPLLGLNPMSGVVEGFRWTLLGTGALDTRVVLWSCVAITALFMGGLVLFSHVERTMADEI